MADEFDILDDDFDGGEMPVDFEEEGRGGAKTSGIGSTATDILNDFKDTPIVDQASEIAGAAIPSIVGDDAVSAIAEAQEVISNSTKELRGSSAELLSGISEIAGQEGVIGGAAKRLSEWLHPGANETITSHVQSLDEQSKSYANDLFSANKDFTETQTKLAALSNAAQSSATKLLLDSNYQSFTLAKYGIKLSEDYYKKSIELKYRHILEAKKQTTLLSNMLDSFKIKLGNIETNTALPDIIKAKTTEALAYKLKANLGDSLYKSFGDRKTWKENALTNLKNKTSSIAGGVQEGVMTAAQLTEMAGMTSEMGGVSGMASPMARSFLGSYLANKFAKSSMGKKFKEETGAFKISPSSFLDKKASESEEGSMGQKVWAGLSSIFSPETAFKNDISIKMESLDEASSFDNRTKNSINIVPTLLGNILNEVRAFRTNTDPDEVKFDHRKGEFTSVKNYKKKIRGEISDGLKDIGTVGAYNKMFDTLDRNAGKKLGAKDKEILGRRLYKRIEDPNFNLKFIKEDDDLFNNLSSEKKKEYMAYFKAAHSVNGVDDEEKSNEIEDSLVSISRVKLDIKGRVKDLIKSGFAKELIDASIIKYDKRTGSYTINEEIFNSISASALGKLLEEGVPEEEVAVDPLREKTKKATEEAINKTINKAKGIYKNTAEEVKKTKTYKNAEEFMSSKKTEYDKKYKEVKKYINDKHGGDIAAIEVEWDEFKAGPYKYLKEYATEIYESREAQDGMKNASSFINKTKKRGKEQYKESKAKLHKAMSAGYKVIAPIIDEYGGNTKAVEALYKEFNDDPASFAKKHGKIAYGLFKEHGIKAVDYLKENITKENFNKRKDKATSFMDGKKKEFEEKHGIKLGNMKNPFTKLKDLVKDKNIPLKDIATLAREFGLTPEEIAKLYDEDSTTQKGFMGRMKTFFGSDDKKDTVEETVKAEEERKKKEAKAEDKEEKDEEARKKQTTLFEKLLALLPEKNEELTSETDGRSNSWMDIFKFRKKKSEKSKSNSKKKSKSDKEDSSSIFSLLGSLGGLLSAPIALIGTAFVAPLLKGLGGVLLTALRKVFSKKIMATMLGGLGSLLMAPWNVGKGISKMFGALGMPSSWGFIKKFLGSGMLKKGLAVGVGVYAGKKINDWASGPNPEDMSDNEKRARYHLKDMMENKGWPRDEAVEYINEKYDTNIDGMRETLAKSGYASVAGVMGGVGATMVAGKVMHSGANYVGDKIKGMAKAKETLKNNGKLAKDIAKTATASESPGVLKKLLPKFMKGRVATKVLKAIPGVGSAITLGMAAKNLYDGDYASAAMNVMLGLSKASPIGAALAIGSLFMDTKDDVNEEEAEKKKKEDEAKKVTVKKELTEEEKKKAKEDEKKAKETEEKAKKELKDKYKVDMSNLAKSQAHELILLKKLKDTNVIDKDEYDKRFKITITAYGKKRMELGNNLKTSTLAIDALEIARIKALNKKRALSRDRTNTLNNKLDLSSYGIGSKAVNIDGGTPNVNEETSTVLRARRQQQQKKIAIANAKGGKAAVRDSGVAGSLCGIKVVHHVFDDLRKHLRGRKIKQVKHLVMHWTAGASLSLGRLSKKPHFGTQIWIEKNGTVHTINEIDDYQQHVGTHNKVAHVSSSNSIGIEMVSRGPRDPLTKQQEASLKSVWVCLVKMFGFTNDSLYYHGQLTTRKHRLEGKDYVALLKGVRVITSKDLPKDPTIGTPAEVKSTSSTGIVSDLDSAIKALFKPSSVDKGTPNVVEKSADAVRNMASNSGSDTNTPGSSLSKMDRIILDAVSKHESKSYDFGFGNKKYIGNAIPTKMSIAEIYDLQDKILAGTKRDGLDGTTAIGKYQFVKDTLKEVVKKAGIPDTTLFTAEVQDKLILARLKDKRGYDDWKNGKITDDEFIHNLSMEFASIEDPNLGTGYYEGQRNAPNKVSDMKRAFSIAVGSSGPSETASYGVSSSGGSTYVPEYPSIPSSGANFTESTGSGVQSREVHTAIVASKPLLAIAEKSDVKLGQMIEILGRIAKTSKETNDGIKSINKFNKNRKDTVKESPNKVETPTKQEAPPIIETTSAPTDISTSNITNNQRKKY